MKRLRVEYLGAPNLHQGVLLRGNPRNPEPKMVSIVFPGGEVTVTRTTADDYWVHARTFDGDSEVLLNREPGHVVDARADRRDQHAAQTASELAGQLQTYREAREVFRDQDPRNAGHAMNIMGKAAIELVDALVDAIDDGQLYHIAVRIRRNHARS